MNIFWLQRMLEHVLNNAEFVKTESAQAAVQRRACGDRTMRHGVFRRLGYRGLCSDFRKLGEKSRIRIGRWFDES